MKLWKLSILYVGLLLSPVLAFAADANTTASAGSRPGGGDATATARYEGDRGFARTDTRTGNVNVARGVAVGVDENGLALSLSNAIAPRHGPAIATTFNVSIDRDGDVSTSTGLALANAPLARSVTAGGNVGSGRAATAIASGNTDRFGHVIARTAAEQHRPLRPVIVEGRRLRR